MTRIRTYRVFMAYDKICFITRYPNTTSKKKAAAEAVTEFLQNLRDSGYKDVRPEKMTVEVEVYEGEKHGS